MEAVDRHDEQPSARLKFDELAEATGIVIPQRSGLKGRHLKTCDIVWGEILTITTTTEDGNLYIENWKTVRPTRFQTLPAKGSTQAPHSIKRPRDIKIRCIQHQIRIVPASPHL